MVITEKQIEEAKATTSAELHLFEVNDEQILARPATRGEWKKHTAMLLKEEARPLSFESLCFDCIVVPDRAGLTALFERQPGAAQTFAREIQKISGMTNEVSAKKV